MKGFASLAVAVAYVATTADARRSPFYARSHEDRNWQPAQETGAPASGPHTDADDLKYMLQLALHGADAAEPPATTAAPGFFERFFHKRDPTANTCGYVSGVNSLALYCDAAEQCVANAVNSMVGCCPGTSTTCPIATACYPYSDSSLFTTDNGYTLFCSHSAYPECVTHHYVDDTFSGYSLLGCGVTKAANQIRYQTFVTSSFTYHPPSTTSTPSTSTATPSTSTSTPSTSTSTPPTSSATPTTSTATPATSSTTSTTASSPPTSTSTSSSPAPTTSSSPPTSSSTSSSSTSPASSATSSQSSATQAGTASGTTTSPSAGAGSSASGPKKSNTGAIAGGVVGGVVCLAVLGYGIFLLLRRRNSNAVNSEVDNSSATGAGANHSPTPVGAPPMAQTPQQQYYEADGDPVHGHPAAAAAAVAGTAGANADTGYQHPSQQQDAKAYELQDTAGQWHELDAAGGARGTAASADGGFISPSEYIAPYSAPPAAAGMGFQSGPVPTTLDLAELPTERGHGNVQELE
ncbi:hypothetical protein SEPCBS119000_005161 [Sporothrix epigloea]|uniref:Uncharacterized protein n=1 Tax=Sporothrix epigloea TaxID=1892477 RepID=A0ABP0DZW8_9PEZI